MGLKDKRVDAYIEKSAEFARPILNHLRSLVHKTSPEIRETIKWGVPHFDYKGMMCSMAAFKEHCAFGFWKASLMKDKALFSRMGKLGMGHLGQIRSLADLPTDSVMSRMIREAIRLNDDGTALEPRRRKAVAPMKTPSVLARALAGNKKAKQTFDSFSPSHKRDYIEWIVEAKAAETRDRRVETAIKWMSEGKPRNWKYMKVKG